MNENVVVKTKNSKGLVALVIILLIMVIVLIGYTAYDKVINNSGKSEKTQNVKADNNNVKESKNNVSEKYNYKNMTGIYKFVSEPYSTDESGNDYVDSEGESDNFTLTLFENGLFYYEMSRESVVGYYGNYTIEGDIIHLNYMFELSGGMAIYIISDDSDNVENIVSDIKISSATKLIDSNIAGTYNTEDFKAKYKEIKLEKSTQELNPEESVYFLRALKEMMPKNRP